MDAYTRQDFSDCEKKLVDIEKRSTKEIMLDLIDELKCCSREFFEDVSNVAVQHVFLEQTTMPSNMKVLEKLTEKNTQLLDIAQRAQEQQCRHHEIDRAKEELRMKNMEILQLHALLTETEQLLSNGLFQARKKCSAMQTAAKNKIISEDLIKYAHRISSSCAIEAPSKWRSGDARRPYPLDIEMRSGLLGKMQERQMDPTQQAKPSYVLITDSPLHNGNKEGHAQKNQKSESMALNWRSVLNSAEIMVDTNAQSDIKIEFSDGLIEEERDVEQMSTSSSSTSSDSP
ncbi:mediator of RNA polymerase II transcription subunit 4-like isoform X2 [Xenia sp. Carnegie-2017]|uniref:mediator of RNA polymerase II transcription subunit 4-like isoform X2 n=1 Tax=Xenia sp. Carnegie-2017 TaxID=2897299 RepID=UPI001F0411BE|nr:mediator of RNA polymerase II transcription subunit 4-like isoform X2 [Xenia sp. Carnegie-2017]